MKIGLAIAFVHCLIIGLGLYMETQFGGNQPQPYIPDVNATQVPADIHNDSTPSANVIAEFIGLSSPIAPIDFGAFQQIGKTKTSLEFTIDYSHESSFLSNKAYPSLLWAKQSPDTTFLVSATINGVPWGQGSEIPVQNAANILSTSSTITDRKSVV